MHDVLLSGCALLLREFIGLRKLVYDSTFTQQKATGRLGNSLVYQTKARRVAGFPHIGAYF